MVAVAHSPAAIASTGYSLVTMDVRMCSSLSDALVRRKLDN